MTVAEARQSKLGQPVLGRSTETGVTWCGGGTTAGLAAGAVASGPCTGSAGTPVASKGGLESADMDSITRKGGAGAGTVMVRRCIRNGIDSEATSTTVHAVIWVCGFRTR